MATGHTIKAFDDDLDRLRALIGEMGGLAEQAIREAMRCLVERDIEGAARIVEDDKTIDALEAETERRAVLPLTQDAAGRRVVERIGIDGLDFH